MEQLDDTDITVPIARLLETLANMQTVSRPSHSNPVDIHNAVDAKNKQSKNVAEVNP